MKHLKNILEFKSNETQRLQKFEGYRIKKENETILQGQGRHHRNEKVIRNIGKYERDLEIYRSIIINIKPTL